MVREAMLARLLVAGLKGGLKPTKMGLFSRRRGAVIQVSLNVRAFVEGRLVRLSLNAQAEEGDRLKDLLKRLSSAGEVEPSLARYILKGNPGITVLHNGRRLPMSEAASALLANGDELSILTPMAGGS